MIILFLNCGSSSVKYSVYDWDKKRSLAAGGVERIGIAGSISRMNVRVIRRMNSNKIAKITKTLSI